MQNQKLDNGSVGCGGTLDVLPHDSLHTDCEDTIVLIHGAFGSRADWDLVATHLAGYHLLLPDLPSMGAARHLKPFSIEYAADLLASLVKAKARHGTAHVVGWSLGASTAVCLAARHPKVVDSMLVTGYGRLPRSRLTPYIPYALWTEQRIENVMPRAVIRWLTDGADMKTIDPEVATVELNRQIFVDAMSDQKWPATWKARTLIIAATKRGIMPTDDNPEVAKKLAEIGRETNADTLAVDHPGMRHPWPRQSPLLFAETVKAWLGQKPLPDVYRQL